MNTSSNIRIRTKVHKYTSTQEHRCTSFVYLYICARPLLLSTSLLIFNLVTDKQLLLLLELFIYKVEIPNWTYNNQLGIGAFKIGD